MNSTFRKNNDTLVGSDPKTGISLVSINERLSYLDAFATLRDRGLRLPPNSVYGKITMNAVAWNAELESVNGAWIDEICVYPARNDVLKQADVRDGNWLIRASEIPKEARDMHNIGLLIVPREFETERGSVIVHPESIRVLRPFMQYGYCEGRPEKHTGFPISASQLRLRLGRLLSDDILLYQKLVLIRRDTASVRPITRRSFVVNRETVVHQVDVAASVDRKHSVSFVREPLFGPTGNIKGSNGALQI